MRSGSREGRPLPQQNAAQNTCNKANVSEIERYRYAVDQHTDERWAWPAGDPQGNQSDASHAPNRYGDASKLLTEQQLTDQRRNDQQRQPSSSFDDSS